MPLADRLVAAVALITVVAPVFGAEEPGATTAFILMAVGVDRPHDRVAKLYGVTAQPSGAKAATVWKLGSDTRCMSL